MLLRKRREYHARAARWLEAHASERLGEYLGQIAEHYTQAGENILAAAYLERSGDEALRTNAYQPAREAFERSLDLLPPEASGRPTLLVKLGQACCNLADYPAALAALEPALAEASQLEDKIQETNALYWLKQVAVKQGEFHKAQGLLADSLPLATAVGGEALARHLYGLGDVSWRLGKPEEARKYLGDCLALARHGGYSIMVLYALNRLGTIENFKSSDELDTAERLFNECLTLAREAGNREREATALYNLGIIIWSRCDYARAKSIHVAGLEIDRELGMPESIAYDLSRLADLHMELGELQEAWRTLQEALALAQPQGAPPVMLAIIWCYARLLAATGDVERALELFGMLRNHPAANLTEFPFYIDKDIAKLDLDLVFVITHVARGASLRLDDVLAEIQAYPGPP